LGRDVALELFPPFGPLPAQVTLELEQDVAVEGVDVAPDAQGLDGVFQLQLLGVQGRKGVLQKVEEAVPQSVVVGALGPGLSEAIQVGS